MFTRRGVDRVVKYAYELANSRAAKHLTSATKSNGIIHSMPYWDARVKAMSERYPDVDVDQFHIDILTACTGTIAIAPSANMNPEKAHPSMFEPVHGSAPDIVGRGIANPIGTIWAGAMMMQHLGFPAAHDAVLAAIENVLREGKRLTPDMGGKATTTLLGKAIAAAI